MVPSQLDSESPLFSAVDILPAGKDALDMPAAPAPIPGPPVDPEADLARAKRRKNHLGVGKPGLQFVIGWIVLAHGTRSVIRCR